ncbi:MAG: glycosyltransferase family 4 protein [bacterium]
MNILIVVSSLSYGGAEKQAVSDANWLSDKHNVTLATFAGGPQKELLNERVNYLEMKKNGYLKTAGALAKYIQKEKIDVVYASLFAPMIISALSTFWHGGKVIWAFHSHEYDIPLKSKLSFALLSRLPRVKKIVFVSKELKSFFRKRFLLPVKKLHVLYNASSVEPAKNINRHKTNKTFNIGYVGRLVELKRVEYLVELARYLKEQNFHNFIIHIVGDGPEKEKLQQQSEKLQVKEHIKFHGFQEKVQPFYDQFDLFINPSSEECLSIALIDAGMRGVTAIAFDVGGNNEIVLNEKTGYIVHSKNELFEKVKKITQKEELKNYFQYNALQHCNKFFSTETHLKNLERNLN